jgi:hypothetical protein
MAARCRRISSVTVHLRQVRSETKQPPYRM